MSVSVQTTADHTIKYLDFGSFIILAKNIVEKAKKQHYFHYMRERFSVHSAIITDMYSLSLLSHWKSRNQGTDIA